jgi:hypothetical protein
MSVTSRATHIGYQYLNESHRFNTFVSRFGFNGRTEFQRNIVPIEAVRADLSIEAQ